LNSPLRRSDYWKSLSGEPLETTVLTRAIYMDESGTDRHQPILSVAGVIINPDKDYTPIEDALWAAKAPLPDSKRDDFIFHASDLYGGNKKYLPKEIWDEDVRHKMLADILAIPKQLRLPVCASYINKSRFQNPFNTIAGAPRTPREGKSQQQTLRIAMHMAAIMNCTLSAEDWLRANTNEVAWIAMEQNQEVQAAAHETQLILKRKDAAKVLQLYGREADLLPLKRIKDEIRPLTKEGSPILQLADACAWAFRAFIKKEKGAQKFYPIVKDQVVSWRMTTLDVARRLGKSPVRPVPLLRGR
jgi:hypothetical protein